MRNSLFRSLAAGFGVVLASLAGCNTPKSTRIELTITDGAGKTTRHTEEFLWANYRISESGMIELALRTEQPSEIDPTQMITQIVYVREFWSPHPGRTYADATQINAHMQYAILTPPTGVRYDGSAFVTGRINRWTGTMAGKIESAQATPACRMGDAQEPFGPVRIAGTFVATENAREVVRIAHALQTQFDPRTRRSPG